MDKTLLLLSTSAVKHEAAKKYAFPYIYTDIKTFACAISGFPEQPIVDKGNTGFHFAKERMNFARNQNDFDEYGFVVSIESCMKYMDQGNLTDICYVLVYSKGLLAHGESFGIDVDKKYADALSTENNHNMVYYNKKVYGYKITVGDIIHKMNPEIDSKNWMKILNGIDREKQISYALKQAMTNLQNQINTKESLLHAYKLYHDYPKFGIEFEDMTPIFEDHTCLQQLVTLMADQYRFDDIDYIVGPELRGDRLGSLLAHELMVGFIAIRKEGAKLPGTLIKKTYGKEYGTDTLIMQKIERHGKRVVVIDDLVATGGSLLACIELCQELNMIVIDSFVFKQVLKLKDVYKQKLGKNHVTVCFQ